jgi:hypothetical protein
MHKGMVSRGHNLVGVASRGMVIKQCADYLKFDMLAEC